MSYTTSQVTKALKAVKEGASLRDFANKHDLALRTLYNIVDGETNPSRNTLKVVGLALTADGLLSEPAVRKKKRAKAA